MKTAEITYLGNLSTVATHKPSGKQIFTDAPTDNQGKGEAFSPTDLLSTSLGCCMLTIMGIIGSRHNLDITGTRIEITKKMADNPRRVVEIIVEMTLPKIYSAKETELLEHAARTCPVAQSLHPTIKQTISFTYLK